MATERCIQVLAGVIVNTIIADPTTFQPDDGSVLVSSPTGDIGDGYVNGAVVLASPQTDS